MTMDENPRLLKLIEKCIKGSRRAHNEFYREVFPYAMGLAMRFSSDREQSLEIVNHAFYKIFLYLNSYDPQLSLKSWVRKIVIRSAIDQYRQNRHYKEYIIPLNDNFLETAALEESILDKMDAEQLLFHIQSLPPSYRMAFTLFAIEGYTHKEIAEMLEISEGTSKSNFFKARARLAEMLTRSNSTTPKAANL